MIEATDNKTLGRLILFPVPIGDTPVSDVLPPRNLQLLAQVKHFIVENTRSARRFIRLCSKDIDIDALEFAELNRHTPAQDVPSMLAPIEKGFDVGVISEAGCPAVADPGADVVAIARQRGYEVMPLVGPSSIILSLMASGFNGQSFAFAGYLPIEDDRRAHRLKEMERRIRQEGQTQIFIETPYRNQKLLADLVKRLPADLMLCVAADITGPNQNIVVQSIAQWRNNLNKYDFNKLPTIFLIHSHGKA